MEPSGDDCAAESIELAEQTCEVSDGEAEMMKQVDRLLSVSDGL